MRCERPTDGHGRRRLLHPAAVVVLVALLGAAGPGSTASATPVAAETGSPAAWVWPTDDVRVIEAYRQPADHYAEGHRGIDLAATRGALVRAPDDGVVAFAGDVAGRPLVTIDHGAGIVSTLEPVDPAVAPGERIAQGAVIGRVATGGHVVRGALHVGARRDREYINPLLLLGGLPRAVLLPCC